MSRCILHDGRPFVIVNEFECFLNSPDSMEDIKENLNPFLTLAVENCIAESSEGFVSSAGFIQLLADPLDRSHEMHLYRAMRQINSVGGSVCVCGGGA